MTQPALRPLPNMVDTIVVASPTQLKGANTGRLRCSGVLSRCEVSERAVRTLGVVLEAPTLDNRTGVGQVHKPMLVQAFVAQPAVEALDVGVLHRLARADERQAYALRVGPRIQDAALELAPVVDGDGLRQSAQFGEPVERCGDPRAGQRSVDLDGQAF